MTTLALSRTCNLVDFPGCETVARWQELLAEVAWAQWQAEHHARVREGARCVNYSGIPFLAPGPEAVYEYESPHSHNGAGPPPVLTQVDRQLAAIYALRVLDRIEAPGRFLTRAAQVLRPHGLLYLTFAFWNAEGEDLAEGHEHRRRIYDVHSWERLIRDGRKAGFAPFGGVDWSYHGHKLGRDYTLASLVLTRR